MTDSITDDQIVEVMSQVKREVLPSLPEKQGVKRTRKTPKAPAKKARSKKLGYYLVSYGGVCHGVIVADSTSEAMQILKSESSGLVSKEMIIPISMEQQFCYPVSMGNPEQVPEGIASSGQNNVYCIQDFDFIPGFPGRAVVVAMDQEQALTMTDTYLRDLGFKTFEEHPYTIGDIPLSTGYFTF